MSVCLSVRIPQKPLSEFHQIWGLLSFTFFKAGAWPLIFALVIALPTMQQTITVSDTDITYIRNIV